MRGFIVISSVLCFCVGVFSDTVYDPLEDLPPSTENDQDQYQDHSEDLLPPTENDQDRSLPSEGERTISGFTDEVRNLILTVPQESPQEEDIIDFSFSSKEENTTSESVEITTSLPIISSNYTTRTQFVSNEPKRLLSVIKTQERQIKKLEGAYQNLVDKVNELEHKTKINNILLMNVQENNNENYKTVLQKVLHILNGVMKLKVGTNDISVAVRVDGSNPTKVRPIAVTFTNFATKSTVLSASNKLKKTGFEIYEDFSESLVKRRRMLLPFLSAKRRQGHRVYLASDKLVVDGVKQSLETLRQEQRRKNKEKHLPEKKIAKNKDTKK